MQNWDEQAATLLRRAEEDEEAVALLAAAPRILLGIIGFHAQQAVEKRLKALLYHRQLGYPQTHDIQTLLDLLEQSGVHLSAEAGQSADLTDLAVQFRYETLDAEASSPTEVQRIVALCQSMREWTALHMR